jgi:DNA-directed RNA polymerase subunit RPC12/RpoP
MQTDPTTSAGFQIEHQCHQCGAPVTLAETDRLIQCPYCRVRSYLVARDAFSYVLPHRSRDRELLYFPYWRFRGVFYACLMEGVEHRFIDASLRGIDAREFPVSLGLRAQTMRLQFATPELAGRFLPPALEVSGARQAFADHSAQECTGPVFHREFVGETLSLIYAPFYFDGHLHDAVIDRPIVGAVSPDLLDRLPAGGPPRGGVQFIPTLCPHCGHDLEGERDALVLTCRNCQSAWRSTADGLVRTVFGRLPECGEAAIYLPFWRVTAAVTGMQLASYADLVRAANLPKLLQESWEERRFCFWVPAFKIRPQIFLLLGRAITLAQPAEELTPTLPELPMHPVNLPLLEAVECAKVLLGSFLSPPSAHLPRLPQIKVALEDHRLAFVPFAGTHTEWVHPTYQLAVNKNAIGFGLQL